MSESFLANKSGIVSLLNQSKEAKYLVHQAKFGTWQRTSSFWRDVASTFIPSIHESESPSLITWVPSARRRSISRGANLPKIIAQAIGHELDRPVVSMFHRKKAKAQKALNARERKANAKKLFTLNKNTVGFCDLLASYEQKARVMIVDDISTTGATLNACSSLLPESNFKIVRVCGISTPIGFK